MVARCVNEPSKRIRTLLASNRARTSDIRTMVDVEEAVEVEITTTEAKEAAAADVVAKVVRMTTNINPNITVVAIKWDADAEVVATQEVEAAAARASKVAGDKTKTKEVAIMARVEETVGTTEAVETTKASNSVRPVIHLRTQSANSNSARRIRCDCSFLAFAKPPQRKKEPAACEVH